VSIIVSSRSYWNYSKSQKAGEKVGDELAALREKKRVRVCRKPTRRALYM